MEEEWRENTFHEGFAGAQILRRDVLPVANQCYIKTSFLQAPTDSMEHSSFYVCCQTSVRTQNKSEQVSKAQIHVMQINNTHKELQITGDSYLPYSTKRV